MIVDSNNARNANKELSKDEVINVTDLSLMVMQSQVPVKAEVTNLFLFEF